MIKVVRDNAQPDRRDDECRGEYQSEQDPDCSSIALE